MSLRRVTITLQYEYLLSIALRVALLHSLTNEGLIPHIMIELLDWKRRYESVSTGWIDPCSFLSATMYATARGAIFMKGLIWVRSLPWIRVLLTYWGVAHSVIALDLKVVHSVRVFCPLIPIDATLLNTKFLTIDSIKHWLLTYACSEHFAQKLQEHRLCWF